MSHDLSRDSSAGNRAEGYAKVRRQQGRLFTDADFNESVDLADRRVRDFVTDQIGPHAGPNGAAGFGLTAALGTNNLFPVTRLQVSAGVYYADGVRVRNAAAIDTNSKDPLPPGRIDKAFGTLIPNKDKGQALLFYLDVWNAAVTPIEDPALRDRGFGDRESCNRERWEWGIRAALVSATDAPKVLPVTGFTFLDPITGTQSDLAGPRVVATDTKFGRLRFAVGGPPDPDDGCTVTTDVFAYTGPSSQLYRVEVHTAGLQADGGVRFKWSRDNAAPAFAVRPKAGDGPKPLESLGGGLWRLRLECLTALGGRRVLQPHRWVEPFAHGLGPLARPLPLLWVKKIDPDDNAVTVSLGRGDPKPDADKPTADAVKQLDEAADKIKKLVLWDHTRGTFAGVPAGKRVEKEFELYLEHGVRAFVEQNKAYLAGEYWQYPARPGLVNPTPAPVGRDPDGPEHLYAPLLYLAADGKASKLRRLFDQKGETEPD